MKDLERSERQALEKYNEMKVNIYRKGLGNLTK